jgi:hypothetical protein
MPEESDDFAIFELIYGTITALLRPTWNAAVYFGTLSIFGVTFNRALAVALLAFTCCLIGYSARWVERGGFTCMLVAVPIWLGALPSPHDWPRAAMELRQILSASWAR